MELQKIRQAQYDLFDTARFFELIESVNLCERDFRLMAAAVAESEMAWNMTYIADCAGLSRTTLYAGMSDLHGTQLGTKANGERRQRTEGAGRKDILEKDPEITGLIHDIIEPHVRGNLESTLRWVSKSRAKISDALKDLGHRICANTVGRVLDVMGYTRQSCKKSHEGGSSPDRDAQFSFIEKSIADFKARCLPFVSVDTKKKELVGNFKNSGSDYHPKGLGPRVKVHDFIDEKGRATPYGVFEPFRNVGFVNVGTCADTGEFAVESIRKWWFLLGKSGYPDAKELLVTADGGGSNGSRNRLWKMSLQSFADETGLSITVRHYPPGTSKWNKIEHGLFSFISQNWRGVPLTSVDLIVKLISRTSNRKGLKVFAEKSDSAFQVGVKASDAEIDSISIEKNESFHPEWNYTIRPALRPTISREAGISLSTAEKDRLTNI